MIIVVDQFGLEREFDYVIFATQGLVAQKILKNGNQKLYDCLGKFEYKPVRVVIHSDDSVMPRDKVDWRGLNITFDGKESMASMWINFIYDLPTSMPDYFETSNLFVEPLSIDKSKIINEYVFPRSFVTMESCDALDVLEQCQGINGFFFVGSWVWPGMPLLEGCVASSVRVAERLGIQRPWKLTENECKPWSKSEELLEVGLVDRFLSNDLCVEKSKSGVMKSIVLAFMHVYLVTLNVFLHLIRYIQ
jgi:predicted NAD/FAD-binding protein